MKTVLHVGCGRQPVHPDFQEWREVRLDLDPAVEPDIVCSMTDMQVVATDSMDAVYSLHNLEHLYRHEVPVALAEIRRVLKPLGRLLLAVPNLHQAAQLVASELGEEPAYMTPAGPVNALDMIYGYGSFQLDGNPLMAHRTGFTAKTLRSRLLDAGFADVEVAPDLHLYNLWATAYKPNHGTG